MNQVLNKIKEKKKKIHAIWFFVTYSLSAHQFLVATKKQKFVLILDLGNGYQIKSTAVRRM